MRSQLTERDVQRLLAPILKQYKVVWRPKTRRSEQFQVLAPDCDLLYTYWMDLEHTPGRICIPQQGSGNPPWFVDLPPTMRQAMIWRNDLRAFLEKRASYSAHQRLGVW